MLPAVVSIRDTGIRIIVYTLALWALTLLFAPVAGMGNLYLLAAVALGAVFTWLALRLVRSPESDATNAAMRLFGWSITYIALLFGAMAADQLLRWGI
jgi:protoheme IX farnesyltransferase